MAETLIVAEFAALLGVSKVAIQGRIKRGTLVAEKVKGRYQIAKSEAERVVPGFADKVGNNVAEDEQSRTYTGNQDAPDSDGGRVGTNVSDNIGTNVAASDEVERLRAELESTKRAHEIAEGAWDQKLEALDAENETLRNDVESQGRGHEATRCELDAVQVNLQDARGEVEHLRALSTSQSESIGTLSTELQGLTAIIHQRRMLDVEPVEDAKPSRLRRWFGGRKRHVRIGQTD